MIKKFLSNIIFFLLILLPNNLFAANQEFFKDAKIHFEKKEYEKSKFLFQKFLVFNPKDHLSYLYLAKIYKKENNRKEIEKNLQTSLVLNPKNEEALYMLVELEMEKSNFSNVKKLKMERYCR